MGIKKAIRTAINRYLDKSDVSRWASSKSLNKKWNERTRILSSFIDDGTVSLIEFGCAGKELGGMIPDTIKYTPSDIVDRDGCLVCDLNVFYPDFTPYDTVFLSGVTEYINDVPALISSISATEGINTIVVSYAPKERNRRRLSQGWVNSYTSGEFEYIFYKNGFIINVQDTWQKQNLYKFVRRESGRN